MGHRGIPARYGGFETLAEELAARLSERGHDVTVYVRSRYAKKGLREYRGAQLVTLPSLPHKYLDTASHTFFSALHALPGSFDGIVLLNAANAIFVPLLRLSGARIALNVDGIERRRKKWGSLGRLLYRISERLATLVPAELVTDAEAIERYYLENYQTPSTLIAYGAPEDKEPTREALDRLGVEPGGYFLYVSRLEPENNALAVVRAFEQLKADKQLLVIGDAPYATDYIASLKKTEDSRILFPGAIFGQGYRELQSHAFAYIHATEVGGTHPALVEAMGFGNAILCHETAENEEVLGDAGIYYQAAEPGTLTKAMRNLLEDDPLRLALRDKARQRARERYSWSDVARRYEALLESLIVPFAPRPI